MARISIDVDGVLANFVRGFCEAVNRIWPGRTAKDFEPSDWNFGGILTHDEMAKVWREIRRIKNFWLTLDAYTDNVGALAQWLAVEADHDVWLTTARSPVDGMTVARQTEIWVQSCGVHPVNNYLGIITGSRANEKHKIYEAMDIEASIDDHGPTVEECEAIKGHRAYLLDRPWNQDSTAKRRIGSVAEFLKGIK